MYRRKEILKLLILQTTLMVELMQSNILKGQDMDSVLTLLCLQEVYCFLQERLYTSTTLDLGGQTKNSEYLISIFKKIV